MFPGSVSPRNWLSLIGKIKEPPTLKWGRSKRQVGQGDSVCARDGSPAQSTFPVQNFPHLISTDEYAQVVLWQSAACNGAPASTNGLRPSAARPRPGYAEAARARSPLCRNAMAAIARWRTRRQCISASVVRKQLGLRLVPWRSTAPRTAHLRLLLPGGSPPQVQRPQHELGRYTDRANSPGEQVQYRGRRACTPRARASQSHARASE